MRTALRTLLLLVAALAGGEARAMVPALTLDTARTTPWTQRTHPQTVRYRWGDILITISSARAPGGEGLIESRVSVERLRPVMQGPRTGLHAWTMRSGPTQPFAEHGLTVGLLDRAGTRFVMWQAHTGGAHCCFHVQLAIPDGPTPGVVYLGAFDMEMMDRAPEDRDGDGLADFVMRDDRFHYAFASFAGSFAPPQILNVQGGRVVDVSAAPGFRALFEEHLEETREGCLSSSGDRNGACAAYAASAARLGRFESAWPEIERAYERGGEWLYPGDCGDGVAADSCAPERMVRYDFPTALRRFLVRHGYLPR
jgi:hypothetical protein